MERTHACGELRPEHIETHVTLCGWARTVRDQSHQMFIDLRDRSGIVQCVIDLDLNPETFAKFSGQARTESCLLLRGIVKQRVAGKENPKLATGSIEVHVQSGEILNHSKPLPFELAEDIKTDENTRIQYRYLDLRREKMRDNLEFRYKGTRAVRDFLDREGFWEIETPLLWKSTPEGAREFLVPATTHPGKGFVLPQSPQICKQLLMVGGVEKYFQIARCFRDETARADRFLEFTQVDLEMSFVGQEDVLDVWERMFQHVVRELKNVEISLPLPRLTYAEAISRYGSDKPDTRYGMELIDLSDIAPNTQFKVFQGAVASGGQVKAICAKGCADYSRKQIDELTELVKRFGARGLATFSIGAEGVKSPVAKFFSEDQLQEIFARCDAGVGDLVMCVADARGVVAQSLDFLRREMAKRLGLIPAGTFNFVWIVDTPMFEYDASGDRFDAMHHPFCLPNPDDMPLFESGFASTCEKSDPAHPFANVRAWLYDLVLNGWEISSGSIRCHRRDIQEQIFDVIGLSKEEAQARFGFMLDAFEYGAPPHGGVACGFDRLVTILAELPDANMRDMVAFPKTTSGTDPLSGAPTALEEKRMVEIGIQVRPQEEEA
jgi:aspartyl-tRNA synthetase